MDQDTKQKLQRLWRNRLLVSVGIVVVSGFSALQIQALLSSPAWTQEARIKVQKDLAQTQAQAQVLEAKVKSLTHKVTNYEVKVLEAQERVEFWNAKVKSLAEKAWDQAWETQKYQRKATEARRRESQALELKAQAQKDLEIGVKGAKNWIKGAGTWAARARTKAESWEGKAQGQQFWTESLKAKVQEAKALRAKSMKELDQARKELAQVRKALVLEDMELEQIIHRKNLAWVLTLKEQTWAWSLARTLLLLSILLITLTSLVFLLRRLRGSSHLSFNAQLVIFFPEECVAELGVLLQRMKKAKASPWEIRFRLLTEILTLLWVFYIQVKLENLWLPSGDRKIDD